jgi:hypothetical protein
MSVESKWARLTPALQRCDISTLDREHLPKRLSKGDALEFTETVVMSNFCPELTRWCLAHFHFGPEESREILASLGKAPTVAKIAELAKGLPLDQEGHEIALAALVAGLNAHTLREIEGRLKTGRLHPEDISEKEFPLLRLTAAYMGAQGGARAPSTRKNDAADLERDLRDAAWFLENFDKKYGWPSPAALTIGDWGSEWADALVESYRAELAPPRAASPVPLRKSGENAPEMSPERVRPLRAAVERREPVRSADDLRILEGFISEEGFCHKWEVKKLCRLERRDINNIMSLLFDQPAFEDVEPFFEMYAVDFNGGNLHEVTQIYSVPRQANHVTIQAADYQMLLHIYAPLSMIQYLRLLNDRKYVFVPVGMGMEGQDSDHQAMICIDQDAGRAYLLDPNGATHYFDEIIGTPMEPRIEALLENYFDRFAEFGRRVTFVPRETWNSEEYAVNLSLAETKFAAGNCVALPS